jgi:thiamine-phosphate pyrophosphorylase
MAKSCLLYYITDRSAFASDEPTRRRRLIEKISEAASAGVDYIQLREKDMSTRDLESLAREAVAAIKQLRTENQELKTTLLINSRSDVALVTGADGVHLRSSDISAQDVRAIWQKCATGAPRHEASPQVPLIGVSCHSPEEVGRAAENKATFAVFAPIFEKKDAPATPAQGLLSLQKACKAGIPVLALGGITLANAHLALEAGAAGIAAIRLFQENNVASVVDLLRQLCR